MGTTAYGEEGSKGRAANGDRPIGTASADEIITPWRHANPPLMSIPPPHTHRDDGSPHPRRGTVTK